jgi:phasin family protein
MARDSIQQLGESWEKAVLVPAQSYLMALANHMEALTNIQIETIKTYTGIALKETRAAMNIHDVDGLNQYIASQSGFAKEFSDLIKQDTEQLTTANQAFMENTRLATQESVKKAEQMAEASVEEARKAAKG